MKRLLLAICLLAGCRDEAPVPQPVSLNADSVGYFCQMNILDHGGPKAQVHIDAYPGKPLFFSQVRDAVVYLRMQEKDGIVQASYVTDMGAADWNTPGTAPWIALDKAVYVVGSSKLGGMDQPEVVPFGKTEAAERFIATYGGQMMALTDIPASVLEAPVPDALASDDADFTARLGSHSKTLGN